MKYNKLVRDKIPEIVRGKGKAPITHVADDAEYRKKLLDKLDEEVKEFLVSESTEELADILEVVYAIADAKGISREYLEKLRLEKSEGRGVFKKRIILEES